MERFIEDINNALSKGDMIVFSSNCEIRYSGRAESYLASGDRVFIIKPDKTLIIHQPEGSAPVNYMKSQTEHRIVRDGNDIYLKSTNKSLKEYMDVKLNELHFYNSYALKDGQKIRLDGTEKDMSDHIYRHPELIEAGFVPLSREEHTKYGFIDLFGYDSSGILVVVECKRYRADLSAVTQLRRYVERIKKNKGLSRCRGIIAAPEISANALRMLNDWEFSYKKVQPQKRLSCVKGQKKIEEY